MTPDARWTLDRLVQLVGLALSEDYRGAPNGRVRGLPDRRAVRWYTTLGLVDRPGVLRGRTALYGPRQLLQVVAVKRRQAAGRSLADIQRELTGATDETLAAAARLPPGLLAADTAQPDEPGDAGSAPPVRRRFWSESGRPAANRAGHTPASAPRAVRTDPAPGGPAVPARSAAPADTGEPGVPSSPAESPASVDSPTSGGGPAPAGGDAVTPAETGMVHGVHLGGGALLVLPAGTRPPGPHDVAALRLAARPLLGELHRRGLARPDTVGDPPAASEHGPADRGLPEQQSRPGHGRPQRSRPARSHPEQTHPEQTRPERPGGTR